MSSKDELHTAGLGRPDCHSGSTKVGVVDPRTLFKVFDEREIITRRYHLKTRNPIDKAKLTGLQSAKKNPITKVEALWPIPKTATIKHSDCGSSRSKDFDMRYWISILGKMLRNRLNSPTRVARADATRSRAPVKGLSCQRLSRWGYRVLLYVNTSYGRT